MGKPNLETTHRLWSDQKLYGLDGYEGMSAVAMGECLAKLGGNGCCGYVGMAGVAMREWLQRL